MGLAACGWRRLRVPMLLTMVVPGSPIWGPAPHEVEERSAPPWDSIQARLLKTSASKELSSGAHSSLVPLEVTPARTVCPPRVRKSGPPESPKQVSELRPGVPRGFLKFQQTKPSAGGS